MFRPTIGIGVADRSTACTTPDGFVARSMTARSRKAHRTAFLGLALTFHGRRSEVIVATGEWQGWTARRGLTVIERTNQFSAQLPNEIAVHRNRQSGSVAARPAIVYNPRVRHRDVHKMF